MEIKIELTTEEVEKIIGDEMIKSFPGKFAEVTIKSYGGVVVEILDKAPEVEKEEGE